MEAKVSQHAQEQLLFGYHARTGNRAVAIDALKAAMSRREYVDATAFMAQIMREFSYLDISVGYAEIEFAEGAARAAK